MAIDTPSAIKVSAVVTAAPRWVGALLAAEGVPLPESWLPWWRILTAILSVGMAITEAFAIAYVLTAIRNQNDKKAKRLWILAIAMLADFSAILAPYIAANVRQVPIGEILPNVALWIWSIAVAVSTVLVVAAVGYASKEARVASDKQKDEVASKRMAKEDFLAAVAEGMAVEKGKVTANELYSAGYGNSPRTVGNWLKEVRTNGKNA